MQALVLVLGYQRFLGVKPSHILGNNSRDAYMKYQVDLLAVNIASDSHYYVKL
jgi:hypothetical protein